MRTHRFLLFSPRMNNTNKENTRALFTSHSHGWVDKYISSISFIHVNLAPENESIMINSNKIVVFFLLDDRLHRGAGNVQTKEEQFFRSIYSIRNHLSISNSWCRCAYYSVIHVHYVVNMVQDDSSFLFLFGVFSHHIRNNTGKSGDACANLIYFG